MSADSIRTLRTLKANLPEREWAAVSAWLATFFPYQLEWILDPWRFALLTKARQIGGSHSYAAAAMIWAMLAETTTVVSKSRADASEVIDKSKKHAAVLASLGSEWAAPVRGNVYGVHVASGGRVIALAAESAGRGYSGNVILDEFGYYEQPDKVWDGAAGAVLHGYRMRVLSTPNGVGNRWHQLVTDPKRHAGYRLHATTLAQAIAQGLRVDMAECWKMALGDPRLFAQLFECQFLDGDAQYIPSELVEGALEDDTYCYEGEAFGGLDIGRTADRTVLYILKVDPDGISWEQDMVECKRTSQDDIDGMVAKAFADHNLRRLCVDATGIGAFPAEALQKRHGKFRVEPVVFTQQLKEDLATTVYQRLTEKRVKIRRSNERLRSDLFALRRIITSAGNVRYDAPHTAEGHADSAWAFALALHATVQPGKRKHEVVATPNASGFIDPY